MDYKYYKDEQNAVYAYTADGSQDDYIKPGMIQISEEEAKILANPPPSKGQLMAFAAAEKTQRFTIATYEIAWRQDALDLSVATDANKKELINWKRYRLALSRVDIEKAPDIEWPVAPE
ncbi:tail fiber assembly protein [Serratia sp. UGAL515B_01]|uniref:tail fiber assembly protein n=1 Tax=Serratia sp. UGAL515B_01 TaxID=2986763 RepID=UPI0029558D0F|nr:tail fiber assembly protein [Serratia sp. UGAL515B_01]WON77846.1 tail fiber assembly protein [Serratia sp. UGAL515B_01]